MREDVSRHSCEGTLTSAGSNSRYFPEELVKTQTELKGDRILD